jgi:uncharacterized protein (DUF302 family)
MFEDRYTFGTRLDAPFDDVRAGAVAALRTEGFGVLTEIDVAATLKTKLDVDRDPYVILGACNPPFAYQAIASDPAIGALLPCNVVVRADGADVVVEVMDPRAVLALVGDPAVDAVGREIRARLARAVDALAAQFPTSESIP